MALCSGVDGFEARLHSALDRVRVVLDTAKAPVLAARAQHRYEDKYLLAERMVEIAVASQLNCLAPLGLSEELLRQMFAWAKGSAVSLRFRSTETCRYVREEKREEEDPTRNVLEGGIGGFRASLTSKVVRTITEHVWACEASYELLAVRATGAEDVLQVLARAVPSEVRTGQNVAPRPQSKVAIDADLNIGWLLGRVEEATLSPAFKVDRSHPQCRTPRRNPDVDGAEAHFGAFAQWAHAVSRYAGPLARAAPGAAQARAAMGEGLFVPVLPLLEESGTAPSGDAPASDGALSHLRRDADAGGSRLMLAVEDANRLLADERRALRDHIQDWATCVGASLAPEASLAATMRHCVNVCEQWLGAVDYIEGLLRSQLIAAIGKEVSPADFAQYMQFHGRKVFGQAYTPVPFCFAVRRSDHHTPEGTVSIEEEVVGPGGDSNIATPITTLVGRGTSDRPMHFNLNASARVAFGGDRYLHAWLSHRFSDQMGAKLSLVARARQFSCMLVLVGRITSADTFDPKHAMLVQNKDELNIPLELSTIPTPKEFKDAIHSLSPEQQEFAKAFRSLQLESTLFGILVIHVKPQLERVLNLPQDSLTKEIKLTQDIMQLFIKYHISSDLLSYEEITDFEDVALEADRRLAAVRGHVAAMQAMIDEAKREEVEERRRQAEYEMMQRRQREEEERARREAAQARARAMEQQLQVMRRCQEERMVTCSAELSAGSRAFCAAPARSSGFGGGFLKAAGAAISDALRPSSSNYSGARSMECAMDAAVPRSEALPPRAAAPPPPPQAAAAAAAAAPQQTSACQDKPPSVPQAQAAQQTSQGRDGEQQSPPQPTPGPTPATAGAASLDRDLSKVPSQMDAEFERLDSDSALRPTIINPGEVWTRRAQKALLAKPSTETLGSEEQKRERDGAFDLLDALTKSGALPIEQASLHVVVAATHCFDETVTETVVTRNCNPIERVERSMLIMASVVHQLPAAALVQDAQLLRLAEATPALFLGDR